MEKYGVVDIGSNTVVLIIYTLENGRPVQQYYESSPAHLIDYVNSERIMAREGIQKAFSILQRYADICDQSGVRYKWADITEPGRIQNKNELTERLKESGFSVYPLSGKEEAVCDYTGTRLTFPEIKNGAAFDVGGGSTELISFQNGQVLEAVSFPLGCVRLAHLPADTGVCRQALCDIREKYALLNIQCDDLIGIGGTMRAAGLVYNAVFHEEKNEIAVMKLEKLYTMISGKDSMAWEQVQRLVDPARIPVFLPGLHMILAITDAYRAKRIFVSPTGIREGFFMERIKEAEGRTNAFAD